MSREQAKKLYHSITNVKEEYWAEAQAGKCENSQRTGRQETSLSVAKPDAAEQKSARVAEQSRRKIPPWLKWCIPAACLCVAVGFGLLQNKNAADGGSLWKNRGNSDGFWGDGDCALLDPRREDFTPGLTPEEEAAFAGAPGPVMRIYRTLYNEWFLAEDITDFSQVLTADPLYIVHGAVDYKKGGSDGEFREGAYGIYTLDGNGQPQWGMGTSGQSDIKLTVPYQFCGLTCDIIEEDLAGVDYEDYIIIQSTQLYTVIIWARCPNGEDRFVTYPARPEFVGLENRRLYTLEEMLAVLREAYRDDQ